MNKILFQRLDRNSELAADALQMIARFRAIAVREMSRRGHMAWRAGCLSVEAVMAASKRVLFARFHKTTSGMAAFLSV